MNIIYDSASGKLFDFIKTIEFGYNFNNYPSHNYIKSRGIKPDLAVIESFNYIWNNISLNTPGLALFFTMLDDTIHSFISSIYEKQIYFLHSTLYRKY